VAARSILRRGRYGATRYEIAAARRGPIKCPRDQCPHTERAGERDRRGGGGDGLAELQKSERPELQVPDQIGDPDARGRMQQRPYCQRLYHLGCPRVLEDDRRHRRHHHENCGERKRTDQPDGPGGVVVRGFGITTLDQRRDHAEVRGLKNELHRSETHGEQSEIVRGEQVRENDEANDVRRIHTDKLDRLPDDGRASLSSQRPAHVRHVSGTLSSVVRAAVTPEGHSGAGPRTERGAAAATGRIPGRCSATI